MVAGICIQIFVSFGRGRLQSVASYFECSRLLWKYALGSERCAVRSSLAGRKNRGQWLPKVSLKL